MALPAIFRRLFRDNGYSSILKPEIVPITNDAASSATNAAASPSLVHNVANNFIKSLSVSGKVITYTKGNGTTGTIVTQDTNTTYNVVTQNANGLMSASDKQKLDGINYGAGKYTLFATWDAPNGQKTVTGCTIGKPVLFIHKIRGAGTDYFAWCYIKPISGCIHAATSAQHHYIIGSGSWNEKETGCTNIFVVIPNSTTIAVDIAGGDDDIVYCFK